MWITESNRQYHLIFAVIPSFLFTILFGIGLAAGMEFKDVQGDSSNSGKKPWVWTWKNWDWLDFSATCLGALIGQVLQVLCIIVLGGFL